MFILFSRTILGLLAIKKPSTARLLEPEKIENIGNRIHTNPRGHVRYHFRHNAEAELTHGTPGTYIGTHSRLTVQARMC